MSVDADRNTSILRAAKDAVRSRRTAPGALGALAACLSPHFPIARVSLRVVDPVRERLAMRGVWSEAETAVGAGVSIPTASTSFLDLERAARSLLYRWEDLPEPRGLLDQVMFDEGLRAWVVVPLRHGRTIVAVLNLSSRDPDAFTTSDLPFFDDLGLVVEDQLLDLSDYPGG
jgi:GAF domain-containing protein